MQKIIIVISYLICKNLIPDSIENTMKNIKISLTLLSSVFLTFTALAETTVIYAGELLAVPGEKVHKEQTIVCLLYTSPSPRD